MIYAAQVNFETEWVSGVNVEAQMSQKNYHQQFNPPPDGSITGVQNQEQITTVTDPAYDEQQVRCM